MQLPRSFKTKGPELSQIYLNIFKQQFSSTIFNCLVFLLPILNCKKSCNHLISVRVSIETVPKDPMISCLSLHLPHSQLRTLTVPPQHAHIHLINSTMGEHRVDMRSRSGCSRIGSPLQNLILWSVTCEFKFAVASPIHCSYLLFYFHFYHFLRNLTDCSP